MCSPSTNAISTSEATARRRGYLFFVFFAHSRLFWVTCDGSKPACMIQRWLGDVSSVWVSWLYCQIILHSRLFRLYCQIIIIMTLLSNCQYLMFGTCIPTLNKSLLLLFIILPCGIHACVCLLTYTKYNVWLIIGKFGLLESIVLSPQNELINKNHNLKLRSS